MPSSKLLLPHWSTACAGLAFAAGLGACSLLFATTDQCASDQDCLARGGAFAQTHCVDKVCQAIAEADSGMASDAGAGDASDPFACALLTPPSPDLSKRVNLSIQYGDLSGGTPASAIDVRLCASADQTCDKPRTLLPFDAAIGPGSGLDAGKDGGWTAGPVDALIRASVEYGFEGFFETRSATYGSALRFTSPALRDSAAFAHILLTPANTQSLADLAKGKAGAYDAKTKGLIFLLARDCNQTPLSGVRFSTSAKDPDQFGFYIVNSLPSIQEAGTDNTGRAGFANLPPGLHTFTAEYVDSGKRIGSVSAVIRAGVATTINVLPSP
jgi:hypothetical protein